MFKLTDAQIAFMDTFGYLSLPDLVADRIEEIDKAFEALMQEHGSQAHSGQERYCMAPCLNHSVYLSSLLDDERIHGIASGLLGEDYQYWNSDGNYYVGDTPWHSDTSWPEPIRFYKIAIYLDPMTHDTGALRVIPGSHRFGDNFAEDVHDQVSVMKGFWGGLDGADVPSVVLETDPGDIVVFNHSTKHSAWGGGAKRRMFTMVYTEHHGAVQSIQAFREIISQHGYTKAEVFGDGLAPLLESASTERMKHLAQLIEYIPPSS
jgi:hypothetical protein